MVNTSELLECKTTVAVSIILCVVGAAHFLIMPLFIGAAAEQLQLLENQQGVLAGLLMSGAAITAFLNIFLVRKFNWVHLAAVALLIMLAATISALLLHDRFMVFLATVFFISIGGGTCYSLALTILSDNSQPDRVFGYSIAAQVSFQVLGLLLLPGLIMKGGLDALLIFLVVIDLIGLSLVKLLPASGKSHSLDNPLAVFRQKKVVYALLGCLFFFFNVGCFWAFIERMGDAFGYAPQTIGNSLAIGVAMGIAGSLTASWQGDRRGRQQPLLISAAGTVLAVFLLSVSTQLAMYVLAVAIYNFVWNYSLAYQYAVVASVDASGRGIAVAPAFHALGAALGPVLAGMVISGDNFIGLNILVAISVIVSFLFFMPAVKR